MAAEETYHGIDPSNGKPLWETPVATRKDLDDAVSVGNTAFKKWSVLPHSERSRLVKEYADGLQKYVKQFTELLVRETGKPPAFAEQEVMMGIMTVRANGT